jgi:cytosine/adenosine deaminase-related metal-dependent hydrolase
VAPVHLDDLLDGPQRRLSAEEIEHETQRLLAVCAEQGVEAVVAEVATCRELLRSLAEACHRVGLTSAAQYLHYLENPYD